MINWGFPLDASTVRPLQSISVIPHSNRTEEKNHDHLNRWKKSIGRASTPFHDKTQQIRRVINTSQQSVSSRDDSQHGAAADSDTRWP